MPTWTKKRDVCYACGKLIYNRPKGCIYCLECAAPMKYAQEQWYWEKRRASQ